jgi:hypothetical protein
MIARGVSLLVLLSGAGCGATRDVIPETHDVRAGTGGEPDAGTDAYVYVARRPLGIVALAEARGMDGKLAARAVDHLADALDSCATEVGRQGRLVDGAARIVAMVGPDGAITGLNVKLAPGAAVAANALLCLVTPLKLTTFPAADADAGSRGLAIEATWGPHTVTTVIDGGPG